MTSTFFYNSADFQTREYEYVSKPSLGKPAGLNAKFLSALEDINHVL